VALPRSFPPLLFYISSTVLASWSLSGASPHPFPTPLFLSRFLSYRPTPSSLFSFGRREERNGSALEHSDDTLLLSGPTHFLLPLRRFFHSEKHKNQKKPTNQNKKKKKKTKTKQKKGVGVSLCVAPSDPFFAFFFRWCLRSPPHS